MLWKRGLMQWSLLELFYHSLCHSGVSSPPYDQVVICVRQSCLGHPWHICCLYCCLICLFIFFNSYVCRDFTWSDLFFLVMEFCQDVLFNNHWGCCISCFSLISLCSFIYLYSGLVDPLFSSQLWFSLVIQNA